jgi:hypothetical protein
MLNHKGMIAGASGLLVLAAVGTTPAAIRVGNAIVSCLDSSAGRDDGAAAVTLAKRIVQRVRAAQQAG